MSDETVEAAPTVNERIARIIEEWVPEEGDFVPAVVASKLLAQLAENSPDLLDEWLHDNAAHFLTVEVTQRLVRERNKTLRRAKARAFKSASDKAGAGDEEPLMFFTAVYVVDKDDTRRRVGEMTGTDHRFVAQNYQESGTNDLMMAAFHRAVAKLVGKQKTAEVMSEQQYDELYQSIVKKDRRSA